MIQQYKMALMNFQDEKTLENVSPVSIILTYTTECFSFQNIGAFYDQIYLYDRIDFPEVSTNEFDIDSEELSFYAAQPVFSQINYSNYMAQNQSTYRSNVLSVNKLIEQKIVGFDDQSEDPIARNEEE